MRVLVGLSLALALTACDPVGMPYGNGPMATAAAPEMAVAPPMSRPTLTAVTSDGVTVHGNIWQRFRNTGEHPTLLLFHQGGSNADGEYSEIAEWLASEGFDVITWDSRAGGELYGGENLTVKTLPDGVPSGFCDALPDLLAAVDEAERNGFGDRGFILWGSSYTGALVFHAAAERPDVTEGVIAFSPASGGAMRSCLAIERAAEVKAPMLALNPPSEIARPTAAEQREQLEALGARYIIPENGIHGSSMLVDERTEADMSALRAEVLEWLKGIGGSGES
ncbi:alpha/beta fold hydrolase [Parvularcula sp. ZS-1/3]|uniref:Alpha/beta fold hydrolase n=1 Tax=Parvularcula mediterranea TaxID=2732508 RepID=A0A7Y3RJ78_9PROT|nr:alpha/beta fold hydrolase [Parvularcula mediterranea]NNU15088.1 alpha/beta fold hydrolase [Parvularcula mediterranea]